MIDSKILINGGIWEKKRDSVFKYISGFYTLFRIFVFMFIGDTPNLFGQLPFFQMFRRVCKIGIIHS